DTNDSKRQLHAAAIGASERAIALNADRVEGHFWAGVNLALFAESNGGIRGARAVLWARGELKMAARISETYHDAGPLRVLGRLEHKAPRLLGGSLRRGQQYLDRALEIAPQNSVTLMYAAELLIDRGDRARAATLLDKIVSGPVDPEWEYENMRDQELARLKLMEIDRA
ncbi:MAG TPA: TRAP transporter TatT component family protein, partial [Blastocatellia bacterium]